uniref:Mitochondrial import receptor subunit TOM20 homolog n=1 Tax=Heterorhabditis bacteriophora TaxID=37862 RepID=A0A1I7XLI1_HETBA
MSEVPTLFGFNRSSLLVAAGLAGAAFIGYCVYFDHKRRSDPNYKEKIRQNRREKAHSQAGASTAGARSTSIPDPTDASSIQAFFLQEVQLGEELLANGNVEEGAIHIANAVALCGQSQQLLQIFQQTLPPEQFAAVVEKLPGTRERLSTFFGAVADAAEAEGPSITYMGNGMPPPQVL